MMALAVACASAVSTVPSRAADRFDWHIMPLVWLVGLGTGGWSAEVLVLCKSKPGTAQSVQHDTDGEQLRQAKITIYM